MANATNIVQAELVDYADTSFYWPAYGSGSSVTFYPGALIGLRTDGYATKLDDAASLGFLGVLEGLRKEVDSTKSSGDEELRIKRPHLLAFALSSGTASRATDIGKIAYAVYDNAITTDPTALTYANPIGEIVDVRNASTSYGGLTGAYVLVKPYYLTRKSGGAKFLAATGTQTLTHFDLGKTIFCPNTAAHTVNLPAVAKTMPGDTLVFVKTTSDAQAITIDGASSETIDGSTTLATMDAQYDTATLVSTGAAWIVVSRDIA